MAGISEIEKKNDLFFGISLTNSYLCKKFVKEMKKILICAIGLLALTACHKQKTFTVEGTIDGAKDSTLYFYNRSMTGIVLLDSTKIGDDGTFRFRQQSPVGPDLYVLRINSQVLNLAIDSTETVTIKASLPGMAQNYSVDGSASCEKIRQLALKHSELQQQVFRLEQNSSLMGPVMVDSLQRLLHAYKSSILNDYIFKEPQSTYAYFALSQTLSHVYWPTSSVFQMGDSLDDRAYRAVATCWKEYYPQSERAQQLYNMVEREINNSRIAEARRQRMQQENIVSVSDIIDLQLPDINGHIRSLSELRGKVVLLDFHIFSTAESGARILKLRELYDRYHARGLEIYQVAIDQDEHLWKQAVEQLPWISVYDPSAESCQRYNVSTLPEFFIVDRNNSLQKRSSQIDDLNAEIERLL